MRAKSDIKKIAGIVRETLSADFGNAKIIDVKVHEDTDYDGEEILRIDVVFEGDRKDVDAKKISGAVRQVRPKLSALGEKAFPLFSFISRGDSDAGRLAPA